MKIHRTLALLAVPVLAATTQVSSADSINLEFDEGVAEWRTVLDGVMGGLSSGRVTQAEAGILRFTGDLSLENNGGFSQMRTAVDGRGFAGADGVELRVRGDGRTYKFDIRVSNVRMMAGAYQQEFETSRGEWTTFRLPFDAFRLYSFGRLVSNAPVLQPNLIESVGVTLSDKRPGPFTLEIDSIRAYTDGELAPSSSGNDLVSVAKGAGLTTLLELVSAAGLELPKNERVTIFAPTNEAFAALPQATVERLVRPEGRDTLRAILTYHVTAPAITSGDLLARRSIDTLNGQRLAVETDGAIRIGEAGLRVVDVPFDGGVVHVIDTVLMPELRSIVDLAAGTEPLSTLVAAVSTAGLGDQLGPENGPWTVFAPVNSAFADLPAGTVESLLQRENRRQLVEILGLHVVPGRLYASDLLASRTTQTLFGPAVTFGIEGGRLNVNGAGLVASDIEAANGVVHLIDTVLLPEQRDAESVSPTKSAEAARLIELAIARGAPLFNEGQHQACAFIYEVAIESAVALGADGLGRNVVDRLRMALVEAEAERDFMERAWIYRRAMDAAYAALARQATNNRTTSTR